MLSLLIAAPAAAGEPEDLYRRALERFTAADFEGSLKLLEQCRGAVADPSLSGRVLLYIGINQAVMGRDTSARKSFRAALAQDPTVDMDPDQFKPAIVSLFNQERQTTLGRLSVSAGEVERVEVLLDGAPGGKTPLFRYVRPGLVRVQAGRRPGGVWAHDEVVQVEAGQMLRLALRLSGSVKEPAGRAAAPSRVATWVVGGAGLAMLAAGAVLGGLSASDHDEWERLRYERKDPQGWEDLREQGQDKQLAANILFGVGGAAVGVAVAFFFLEPRWSAPKDRAEGKGNARLRLTPLLGRSVGLGLEAQFR